MAENRVDQWKKGWQSGRTDFHRSNVHGTLLKFYGKLTDGKKGLKFFLPLCGKTLDMTWLAEQGQCVIGVEGVEMACQQFFKEQNLKYSVTEITEIPGGKLYMTDDGKIKIYQCDALAITKDIIGEVDIIWDRGATVAIDPADRKEYVKMLQNVTKLNSRLLFEIYEYDIDQRITQHAPYPLFRHTVDELFGSWRLVSEVDRADVIDESIRFRSWGLSWMTNIVYLMTEK